MTNEQRKKKIIDFINKNKGCSKQAIINFLDGDRSRKPALNLIKELEIEGIVIDIKDKPNSKNSKLFVNNNNLFAIVPRELDEFESLFITFFRDHAQKSAVHVNDIYPLIRQIISRHKKKLKKRRLTLDELGYLIRSNRFLRDVIEGFGSILALVVKALEIFREFVQTYTIRAIIEWPNEINDSDSLNKLITISFFKISLIQTEIVKIINSTIPNLDPIEPEIRGASFFNLKNILIQCIFGKSSLDETRKYYRLFGIENDIRPLLDFMAKINKSTYKTNNYLPLNEWGLHDPSEWNAKMFRRVLKGYDPD